MNILTYLIPLLLCAIICLYFKVEKNETELQKIKNMVASLLVICGALIAFICFAFGFLFLVFNYAPDWFINLCRHLAIGFLIFAVLLLVVNPVFKFGIFKVIID